MRRSDEDKLKKIAERWIEEGWQRGNIDIVDELHSPAFVDHDSAGRPSDREGFKRGIQALYSGFPDLHCIVEDLVVDVASEKVAVRWSGKGTHKGEFFGFDPTGKKIRFKGIEIIHLHNGRITDRWGEWDGMDILAQLGRASQESKE